MCKHMVDADDQKGPGETMPVSEDAEAEICSRLKRNRYIHKQPKIFS